jgi:hypothetical protein
MNCEFEPHRPASFFLAYDSAVKSIPTRGHIFDADRDNVTAAELAVDREVEERQIAFAVFHLKPGPNGPNLAGPERWLRTNELPLVPR